MGAEERLAVGSVGVSTWDATTTNLHGILVLAGIVGKFLSKHLEELKVRLAVVRVSAVRTDRGC